MLTRADQLHHLCRTLTIVRHGVGDEELRRLAADLRVLRREVGAEVSGQDWQRFLAPIGRFSWIAAHVPVPYARLVATLGIEPRQMESALRVLRNSSRHGVEHAIRVHTRFTELARRDESPLLGPLRRLVAEEGVATILLAPVALELVRVTEEVLRAACLDQPPTVRLSRDLGSLDPMPSAAAAGVLRSHPRLLVDAPRFSTLHVVAHAWCHDLDLAEIGTASMLPDARGQLVALAVRGAATAPTPAEVHVADPEVHQVDLEELMQRAPELSAREGGDSAVLNRKVVARAFRLAGGALIFFHAEHPARILEFGRFPSTTRPGDVDTVAVESVEAASLEPGMFLIERGRSGDVAMQDTIDHLLGSEQQSELKRRQDDWKSRLRGKIERHGLDHVARELQRLGCECADHRQNIRSWAGPDRILPQDRQCFDAIMRLIGLGNRASEYWAWGSTRRGLGHTAGREINRRLLSLLGNVDRATLESRGTVDVTLSLDSETRLSIYRVESIARTPYRVLERMQGMVLPDAWSLADES
jgi:hypothetical protein